MTGGVRFALGDTVPFAGFSAGTEGEHDCRDRTRAPAAPVSLHHRQRGLRALQLLRNAGIRNEAAKSWIAGSGLSENAFLMFFFAGFAFVAALAFAGYARRYPMQDNYRNA